MTKWIYKNNFSKVYSQDEEFIDELGTKYGTDWNKNSIAGMQLLKELPRPSDIENRVFGQVAKLENGELVLAYEFEPRTPEDLKRVTDFIQRKKALEELETLDRSLPRGLEDLIETNSLGGNLPEIQKQRIARKSELRTVIANTQYLFQEE